MNRSTAVAVGALLCLSLVAGPALAGVGSAQQPTEFENQGPVVRGEPDLDVYLPNDGLRPGEQTQLTVVLANGGEIATNRGGERASVTTARDVTVAVDSDHPGIDVKTATQSVGTVTEAAPREVPVVVEVDEDIAPGSYDLEVDIEYTHTSLVTGSINEEDTVTTTEPVSVDVTPDPRFRLRNSTLDGHVGESGPVTFRLENVGNETARNASVRLTSRDSHVALGGANQGTVYVGTVAPGESKRVSYDATVSPDAAVVPYEFEARVSYTDSSGDRRQSDVHTFGAAPNPEQAFGVRTDDATLSVGADGTVTGDLVNEASRTVEDVVLRVERPGPNLQVRNPRLSVGTLAPNESRSFSVRVDVADSAVASSREIRFTPKYETADGERYTGPTQSIPVSVEPERAPFDVRPVESNVTRGSTGALVLEVENALDQRVTNVDVRLHATDPLSSSDDTRFVPALRPGETTTLRFDVATDGGVSTGTYSANVDFRYDDERGESQMTESTAVGVRVTDGDSGGALLSVGWTPVALSAVVCSAVGGVLWRRR